MSRYMTVGIGVGAVVFAVLSARLGVPPLAYGVVGCAVAAMVLCAWGKLDGKAIPYLVFLLGLAFLYQSTLISNGLVGTDIHTEYYFYRMALDGWDTTIPHAYNTAIGATVIAPFLTNCLGVPGLWIFKAVFPALFALVPAILYIIYRKEFGERVAFLGCVLFITVPTYLLEMIGLPRQMLGELMLALCMLLIVVRPLRMRYLIPCLAAVSLLGYMFHYVMGFVIFLMVAGCALVMLATALINRYRAVFTPVRFPIRWLALCLMLPAILGVGYYQVVAEGVAAKSMNHVLNSVVRSLRPTAPNGSIVIPAPDPITGDDIIIENGGQGGYFHQQEPLIRTALGLDFADASPVGKGFRLTQFAIQLSILLGCAWLVWNRKRVSMEFIGFAVAAMAILAACVLLPRVSNVINATRFFHLAIFALAPLVVLGATWVLRNLKITVLVLLVPYMLFNTGVVFELARESDISRINAPYSIPLSNHRLGAVAIHTDHDIGVVEYAVEYNLEPILSDINGMLLLSQYKSHFTFLYRSLKTGRYHIPATAPWPDPGFAFDEITSGWGYMPQHTDDLPLVSYLFLTEHSMRIKAVTFKPDWFDPKDTTTGMRRDYPFDLVGISDDMEVVYRSGDAVILVIRREGEV